MCWPGFVVEEEMRRKCSVCDSSEERVCCCRFHVDKLSSAHVYLRLHKGQTVEMISPELLEDCAQLVKANSIQGLWFTEISEATFTLVKRASSLFQYTRQCL